MSEAHTSKTPWVVITLTTASLGGGAGAMSLFDLWDKVFDNKGQATVGGVLLLMSACFLWYVKTQRADNKAQVKAMEKRMEDQDKKIKALSGKVEQVSEDLKSVELSRTAERTVLGNVLRYMRGLLRSKDTGAEGRRIAHHIEDMVRPVENKDHIRLEDSGIHFGDQA